MGEWISAVAFGIGVLALVLGLTSIIMAFIADKSGNGMQEKVEYGFFGVTGFVIFALMGYALA
ncbi:hypothetical protein [Opacimonas viscosa]|uniref:Uncharacterized protein n=1 Tax=Opacimonas viscosa TaxID=2961944 RepID=A0AA41X3H6_9ALTE|nr:hypothetical protein [Opacimonas viscosa]MCP3429318.1 hypothetical protein [Opacimonas viscosa]